MPDCFIATHFVLQNTVSNSAEKILAKPEIKRKQF